MNCDSNLRFSALVESRTQICAQAARRHLGDIAGSQDALTKFRKLVPNGVWHDTAGAELWSTNRVLQAPRRLGKAADGCLAGLAGPAAGLASRPGGGNSAGRLLLRVGVGRATISSRLE